MTDESKAEITKVTITLIIATFECHGYLPAALDLRLEHGDEESDVLFMLLACALHPVSGEGNPLHVAGTLRMNTADQSLRMHLVSDGG
jgi:hypothetical protein